MIRGHSTRLTLALLVCLVLALGYANSEGCLVAAARWLNVGEQPRPADYVLILNGDPNVRPFVGSALVKAGLASKVLLVPMKAPAGSLSMSHVLARKICESRGISGERIIELPGVCDTTFDEATALARFLKSPAERTAKVAVVTSHFHTRRARWIFRKVLGADASRLSILAAPVDGFTEANWWQVEDGFLFYVIEYLKLVFYLVRYDERVWVGLAGAVVGCGVLAAHRRAARRPGKGKSYA